MLFAQRREREHVVQVGEDRLRMPQLPVGKPAYLGLESLANRCEPLATPRRANLVPDLRERESPHKTGMPIELAATALERIGDVVKTLRVALPEELGPDPPSRRLEQLLARRVVPVNRAQRNAGRL